MRRGIIEQYLAASHGLASEAALHGSDRTLIFSETLPAHFRYYLVTTDAGGHWVAKKNPRKLSITAVADRRLEKIELTL
jgi:hypothetical protein